MARRHIPALDGLRGIAVLLVFLYHAAGGAQSAFLPLRLFGLVNKAGSTGVSLFFVLSGFLITGILWDSLGEPHWWRNFYVRRALRIFPLYFATLGVALAVAAALGLFLSTLATSTPGRPAPVSLGAAAAAADRSANSRLVRGTAVPRWKG